MADREWTELTGLRDAVLSLLLRSTWAMIIWGLVTWFLVWFASQLPISIWFLIIVGAFPGIPIGIIESRGLVERAGFSGFPITALAGAFAIGSILGATLIVEQITTSLPGSTRYMFCGSGIAVALVFVFRYTFLDD